MQPCSTAAKPEALESLIRTVDADLFRNIIRRLHTLFSIYADTCPVPLPAPRLIITPEMRNQCQCYLPIFEVTAAFHHLYRSALTYDPILSSTPFHRALSWADVFVELPPQVQFSTNPARLLESLCADHTLLTEFLFASFLPSRFYNGFGRYPRQQEFIRKRLACRKTKQIRCLDAACGAGEGTYDLALMLSELGIAPEAVAVNGWTLEPLEVWAATERTFPHDRGRETALRKAASNLANNGYIGRIAFSCRDILTPAFSEEDKKYRYDIILCNGLLGGPILHEKRSLALAISNLAQLLAPNGVMLAADSFHGGWRQKCPQSELRALFEENRLSTFAAGEGIGGLKPDQ